MLLMHWLPEFHAWLSRDLDSVPAELKVCSWVNSTAQSTRQSMGCVHLVLVSHFPHSLSAHHAWLVHRRKSCQTLFLCDCTGHCLKKKGLSLFPFDNLHVHSSSKTAGLCFENYYNKYFGHTSFFFPSSQSLVSSKDFTFEVKDILREFKWIFADLQLTNFKWLMRSVLYISLIYCFKTYKETKRIIYSSEYNIICLSIAK